MCIRDRPNSIYNKLQKMGYEFTTENIQTYLNDVAGVRIVCAFIDDIYMLSLIHIFELGNAHSLRLGHETCIPQRTVKAFAPGKADGFVQQGHAQVARLSLIHIW